MLKWFSSLWNNLKRVEAASERTAVAWESVANLSEQFEEQFEQMLVKGEKPKALPAAKEAKEK